MINLKKKFQIITFLLFLITFFISPLNYRSIAISVNATSNIDTSILKAIGYLKTQQNDDGGIRWTDDASSMAATIRTVLAVAAADLPQDVLSSSEGLTPLDFLAAQGHDWIFDPDSKEPELNLARAGQLLIAVAAANQDPYVFGSEQINLPYLINTKYDPSTGIFGKASPKNVTDQVWAILGLASSYATVPQDSIIWLTKAQQAEGSWDDGFGSALDITPLALMALLSSGEKQVNDPEIQLALQFFKENQKSNGGWQTEWDSTTSANVTGMIVQSLYAAEQNPTDPIWVAPDGSPQSALMQIQQENGAFGADFINAFGTADAILGLSGKPLYDLGHVRKIGRAYEYIFASQSDDGGWGSAGQTLDSILVASLAGWNPESIAQDEQTPISFLSGHLEEYIGNGPDAIGKSILALVAGGYDPASFNGFNLIEALMENYSFENQAFGDPENTWHQALGILGLKAANTEIPDGAIQTLLNLQRNDGGWEYATGFGTWPDSTAIALQAIFALEDLSHTDVIKSGLGYLKATQLENGGWGDASTSAFVIMALNAMNENSVDWRSNSKRTPIQNLLTYQKPSGAFMFSEDFTDDNLLATTAAVLAAMGGHYFIQPPTLQSTTKSIGLVIQTDQKTIATACIDIEGNSISGLTLLDASGIPYETQDGFINSILDRANPAGDTLYWSYWHWDGREWAFYSVGAGEATVLPGSVEGWYLTSWEQFPSLPPEFVPNLKAICGENGTKNYRVQPYINYYDLYQSSATKNQALKYTIQTYSHDAEIPVIEKDSKIKPLSTTPIIIIGVSGVFAIGLIVWLIFRRK